LKPFVSIRGFLRNPSKIILTLFFYFIFSIFLSVDADFKQEEEATVTFVARALEGRRSLFQFHCSP